ncbi:MAG: hypothetical protein WA840_22915 [Caulobacteraceae bacterium]
MASRDPAADDVDFFPTPPWGARAGGELVQRIDPGPWVAWEPACGPGVMAHGLADYFPILRTSDAYRYGPHQVFDFVRGGDADAPFVADWIMTNPPFSHVEAFLHNALRRARRGVALLCRLQFLETIGRHELIYGRYPMTAQATFAERLPMGKGRYDPDLSTASAYAWHVFYKRARQRRFCGTNAWMGVHFEPGTRARLTRPSDRAFAVDGAC